jgi:hypothetical protein
MPSFDLSPLIAVVNEFFANSSIFLRILFGSSRSRGRSYLQPSHFATLSQAHSVCRSGPTKTRRDAPAAISQNAPDANPNIFLNVSKISVMLKYVIGHARAVGVGHYD